MTYFSTDGPDIPEDLLKAHEEGKVVFFCGAGISIPSGLPSFCGLVNNLYTHLGTIPEDIEQKAINLEKFDAAIDLLERRFPGKRIAVRQTLPAILKPNLRRKNATTAHRALLKLSTDRNNNLKLVTTNFDQLFERSAKLDHVKLHSYSAPLLPIPKQARWNGLVYLHGLLDINPSTSNLNSLVLSSGDFGLAYLTERWASRFVTDLFKNYIVCFVGYGINDPVLRYMMDAIAADEILGERRQIAYAFGDFQTDAEKKNSQDLWKSKGVVPLLYKAPLKGASGKSDHVALYSTLDNWAKTYQDGTRGREALITAHAPTPPLTSKRSDFAVGRVLWALTDGQAAHHFATLNPVPPLDWLEPLSDYQFGYTDLVSFGVTPDGTRALASDFSFLNRPAPYSLTPTMKLVSYRVDETNWDEVMQWLAHWLTRHLNDPELFLWLVASGGILTAQFEFHITRALRTISELREPKNSDELARALKNAPNYLPRPALQTLLSLFLSNRVKVRNDKRDFYTWLQNLTRDGLTTASIFQLRKVLEPKISLRARYEGFMGSSSIAEDDQRIKDIFHCEIELAADHAWSLLDKPARRSALETPEVLDELSSLLTDAMNLAEACGMADDKADSSYMHHPSIEDHQQNRKYHDWTILIELTRDAWLATAEKNGDKALTTIEKWLDTPYPLFRRLAFFAATYKDIVPCDTAIEWLMSDNAWWLWSVETQRETIRLIAHIGSRGNEGARNQLETAIVAGPPRSMYKDNLEPGRWTAICEHNIWLLLSKLQDAKPLVNVEAQQALSSLTDRHPNWTLAADRRDEFPMWMGEGSDHLERISVPESAQEIAQWLKTTATTDPWVEDDWGTRCLKDFPATSEGLILLAREKQWPIHRWREAIQAWTDDSLLADSWSIVNETILSLPQGVFDELARTISWWLEKQADSLKENDTAFFEIVRNLLEPRGEPENPTDDPVGEAINHPVGQATQALISWWFSQKPQDEEGLKEPAKGLFTNIATADNSEIRHGRVILGTHAIALYRVDSEWTKEYLLPLFNWEPNHIQAKGLWEGFLWSPRVFHPLLRELRKPYIESASHYSELGSHAEQYARFFTYIALDKSDVFTEEEMKAIAGRLPVNGLEHVADTLSRALQSSGAQRHEYWTNRVSWFIQNVWPKTVENITNNISEEFAKLCISAEDDFAEALNMLRHWLRPLEHPDYPVHLLEITNLCDNQPKATLDLLALIVGENAAYPPSDLGTCLNRIEKAMPSLSDNPSFIFLSKLWKKRA